MIHQSPRILRLLADYQVNIEAFRSETRNSFFGDVMEKDGVVTGEYIQDLTIDYVVNYMREQWELIQCG